MNLTSALKKILEESLPHGLRARYLSSIDWRLLQIGLEATGAKCIQWIENVILFAFSSILKKGNTSKKEKRVVKEEHELMLEYWFHISKL